jgi:methylmalonyl-CoA mutase cobalamin-binding subunit
MTARAAQLRVRLARSLQNVNPQGAHNALDEAFASLSLDAALSEVVLPCLQALDLGSAWGASARAQIQFATGLLQTRLLALASGWESGGSPAVVVAYTGAEQHTLGGIVFCLALRDRGWRIAYMGTSPSARSAVELAEGTDALAVVLVARHQADLDGVARSVHGLSRRRHLVLAGDGATVAAARDLHAELLPHHPVLAARELHRRAGGGPRRHTSTIRSRRTPEVHSSL